MIINYYTKVRKSYWLGLFTINLRTLLGVGFLIGGLRKVNGNPFANPGQEGAFFEFLDALHANLIYYEFIGWAQVISGLLLITHRYATLGAVIYFPIILNIAVFTVFSVGSLTPLIASLMCLGCLYLLLWDYPKWMNILAPNNQIYEQIDMKEFPPLRKYWKINAWLTLILPTVGMILLFLFGQADHSTSSSRLFVVIILLTIAINLLTNFYDIYLYHSQKKTS